MEKDARNIRQPVIRLGNGAQLIALQDTLKYLGIIFDRKVSFAAQVKSVRAKVNEI